jgi:hypothetical protein
MALKRLTIGTLDLGSLPTYVMPASRLIEAWPHTQRIDRRRFELLKRTYVEARYSDSYEIDMADLEALSATVRALRDLVEAVSCERLAELKGAAGL